MIPALAIGANVIQILCTIGLLWLAPRAIRDRDQARALVAELHDELAGAARYAHALEDLIDDAPPR